MNYWCTWGIQNALSRTGTGNQDCGRFAGDQGARSARRNMSEELLFGSDGWAETMFPKSRKDLLLLLDDGWDVPLDADPCVSIRPFSALVPDAGRFPGLGATGAERLKNLNERIAAAGWMGAALWVACQGFGEGDGVSFGDREGRDCWRRRMEVSQKAGIRYWKIDWGARDGSVEYRKMIGDVRDEVYPELVLENKPLSHWAPFNGIEFRNGGECKGTGRIFGEEDCSRDDWTGTDIGRLCAFSDVVRIYDMLQPLDGATAFDRIAFYGMVVDKTCARTVLNVEGSVVAGAVLGHAFGIMRAPGVDGGLYGPADDVSRLCKRIAEVDRAVAWQRIAPAFGGRSDCRSRFSKRTLTDVWRFKAGEGWLAAAWGREVFQCAPAVLSRGMELPEVHALEAEPPFVAAMSHPNGAVSVGAFPRVCAGRYWTPKATVKIACPPAHGRPLAVFGEMAELRIPGKLATCGARVFAKDLAGGEAHEITSLLSQDAGGTVIPGDVLAEIGREADPQDVHSAPGTLVFATESPLTGKAKQ